MFAVEECNTTTRADLSSTIFGMSAEVPAPPAGFSVFNVQANRRIYQEFVSQHDRDRSYILELEKLLREHAIAIPAEIVPKIEPKASPVRSDALMPDGSLSALEKSVERLKGYSHHYEINVQYKDLTFWNSVPEPTIPTVGSSIKGLFCGSGPKRRVDIFKNLTGRILPKTMTLLMGPPGCGRYFAVLTLLRFLSVEYSERLQGLYSDVQGRRRF